jgi:Skp family chaperone for outer membrane proteins
MSQQPEMSARAVAAQGKLDRLRGSHRFDDDDWQEVPLPPPTPPTDTLRAATVRLSPEQISLRSRVERMVPAATVLRSNLDNIGSSIARTWGDRIIGADPHTSADLINAKEQLDVLIQNINDLISSEKAELASQGRTHIGESEKKAFAALETLKHDAEIKASAVQKRFGNKETKAKAKAMIAKTANKPIDVSIQGGRRRKATRRRRSRKASNTRINKKARNNKSRATRRTKSRSPNRRTRHRNR